MNTIERKEKVSTLEKVFQLCKGKMFINIELKDDRLQLTFDKVIEVVEKYNYD